LVKLNRKKVSLKNSEGYVLEELASISYMANKGYTKIGPKSKENPFDKLTRAFNKEPQFEYF
jgi:hypothetical protein